MIDKIKTYQSEDIECPFCGRKIYITISPPPPNVFFDIYEADCICGFSTYMHFFGSEEELRQYCLMPKKRYLSNENKSEEKYTEQEVREISEKFFNMIWSAKNGDKNVR